MSLILATRGEHVHVRKKGRLKKGDPVRGFSVIGWVVDEHNVQEVLVLHGEEMIPLSDFEKEFPGHQIDLVGFPVVKRCCDLHRGGA